MQKEVPVIVNVAGSFTAQVIKLLFPEALTSLGKKAIIGICLKQLSNQAKPDPLNALLVQVTTAVIVGANNQRWILAMTFGRALVNGRTCPKQLPQFVTHTTAFSMLANGRNKSNF
jgi:hypothetical protein